MDNHKLLPCPFCGWEYITICNVACDNKTFDVTCDNCRASTATFGTYNDIGKQEAILAWNTRTNNHGTEGS